MPFTIYEGGPTPGVPKRDSSTKKSKGSWLGRLIRFLFGIKTSNTVEKTNEVGCKAARLPLTPERRVLIEMKAKYAHNYGQILQITSKDLPYMKAVGGRLERSDAPTSKEEQKDAIALIHQTVREARGDLAAAHHGKGETAKSDALQKLDFLRLHLAEKVPEALPRFSKEHPMSSYKTGSTEELPKKIQEVKQKEELERRDTVRDIMKRSLSRELLSEEESGINVAHKITSKSTGETKAIMKSALAEDVGDKIFIIEHGHAPKNNMERETELKYQRLGGTNEIIASELDFKLGSALNLPLASLSKSEGQTHHTFIESIGSYEDVVREEGFEEYTSRMPTRPAQAAVMGWMSLGALDAHGANALVRGDGAIVGIDYGNILGPTPDSPDAVMTGIYYDWPCLDQPIDPTLKENYLNMDPKKTVAEIRESIKKRNPKAYNDPELRPIIEKEFKHLERRLTTIQEGIKAGLNQRQILSLFVPSIPEDKRFTSRLAIGNYVADNCRFVKAWRNAKKVGTNFKSAIKKQIEEVKADPTSAEPMSAHTKKQYHQTLFYREPGLQSK